MEIIPYPRMLMQVRVVLHETGLIGQSSGNFLQRRSKEKLVNCFFETVEK